jgi:segregation and condensation protein B
MSEPNAELKNIIEAALLVAGQPLTIDKMLAMFPSESPPTREEIRDAISQLEEEYAERVVELKQIDRAWRIQTAINTPLDHPAGRRASRALFTRVARDSGHHRLPPAGDALAISRMSASVSTDIIKTLLGREWIRQVHTQCPGTSALYGTTREFLEHFNESLEELPPLSALRLRTSSAMN